MRCYYTLNELRRGSTGSEATWNTLFTHWYVPSLPTTEYNQELFKICRDRFGEDCIVYLDICGDVAPTVDEIAGNVELRDLVKLQLLKIARWVHDSAVKYETLIKLYTDNENALMNRLTSRATNQFNDTPQTTTTGLDSDNYASTYSVNTTETDPATTIQKLSEIRALWLNMYTEWADEFAKKFVL